MKLQMKQYFIEKYKMIKEWMKREKWFLMLLSFMTISLFVSMFTEYALIACILVTIASSVVFDLEHNLGLFLFCYAYESVFIPSESGSVNNLFSIVYAIILSISLIKHILNFFRKKESINLNYFIVLSIFLFYILATMKTFDLIRVVRYCIVLIFIYLVLKFKSEIKFDNVILYAVLGVFLSIIFGIFVTYSSKMTGVMEFYYNYGIKKTQGLFINPNHFAIYIILLIALVLYKFIFENSMWGIALLIMFPYSYSNLSRNYILCFIFIVLMITCFMCIKRNKFIFFRYLTSLFILAAVLISQPNVTKVYLNRIGSIYTEASQLIGINTESKGPLFNIDLEKNEEGEEITSPVKPNNKLWIDGTPIDPGRVGLWKRYMKDYTSSWQVILFGRGLTAVELGKGAHNSFIEIIWRFGIVGVLLISSVMFLIAKEILKGKSFLSFVVLGVIFIINLFESCVFNSISIMMILILICSIQKKEDNHEKSIGDNTSL